MSDYKFHEFADKFRLMNNEEFEGLKEDIRKNGLLNTICIFNGKILDGRNRYNACKELKISPKYYQFKGTEEEAFYFVISLNLTRRHLNPAERAEIGLIVLEWEEAWAKERQLSQLENVKENIVRTSDVLTTNNKNRGKALEIASKKIGVGRETLQTAKKVQEINDPEINKKWKQAKEGKTTIKSVKVAIIKKENKEKPTPKLPQEKYNVIYADPPWEYNFSETPTRALENQYPTMELSEIKKLKIPSADNSILFLWCPAPKLYPEGMEVIKAWGFIYKTCMVWVKDRIGMGYYARNRHELLLIATKGSPGVPEPSNRPDSVIEAPRTEHSKKPEIMYELIEQMYPHGKYLELFARNKRGNWKSWGNEVKD